MRTKITVVAMLLSVAATGFAQDQFDAAKLSLTQLKGSARYMGMGGAFTALGGDASSISLNPAGLGVYRSSELTATLNVLNNSTSANWNNVSGNDSYLTAHFNNFSIVATIGANNPNFSSALGFTFDRLKSFNRSGTINGASQYSSITDYIAERTGGTEDDYGLDQDVYSNTSIGWISVLGHDAGLISSPNGDGYWYSTLANGQNVTPSYSFYENGYLDQYSFSYGMNFSNLVYLGFGLGFQSFDYSLSTYYIEKFDGNGSMSLQNQFSSSGSGFDMKVGVIVRPTDFLRIGAAYHSPMFMSITDRFLGQINNAYTPDGSSGRYYLQTPSVFTFGLAGVFGKKGILSVDYQYADYSTMKYRDESRSPLLFKDENSAINNQLQAVSSIKIGGEYRITPEVSARLGYNYITPVTKNDAYRDLPTNSLRTDPEYMTGGKTQNFAVGLGYRYQNWNFDVAYVLNRQDQQFYPYDDYYSAQYAGTDNVKPAKVTSSNSNIAITVGLKF